MGWREAWRLGVVAYDEVSFQAVYAVRQGNLLPAGPAAALVPRARRRVAQSKAVVSVVLGLLTAGAAGLARQGMRLEPVVFSAPVPLGVFDTGVVAALLALDAAFLWWTGLQVLPTLLSSAVLPALEPLPIDARTLRRAAAVVYLRLFDAPVSTVLVLTPVAIGLALGPVAGIAVLPGAVAAVVFSLALSLLTGRYFVRRIQGTRGGGSGSVRRWALLLLWLVPSFAILGFVTAGGQFLGTLAQLAAGGPTLARAVVYAAFPVPFALLAGIAAQGTAGLGLDPRTALAVGVGLATYLALTVWATGWLYREVRELGHLPGRPAAPPPLRDTTLRPQAPPWAVLTKDLRIASRTPGYAFLLLLPILDALALGLISVADAPGAGAAEGLGLGAVTATALLATFFGPAFFAIEVLAYSYGRTLPLRDRSVMLGKATLLVLLYLTARARVLGLVSVRGPAPFLFVAFVAA